MKYVIANWKQNKTLDEAVLWCRDFVRLVESANFKGVIPIICPPAPFLEKMWSILKWDVPTSAPAVELGVQDISPFADGAHTGFVGVNQVKEFCKYAVVGHSERQELPDVVLEKVARCLDADIIPIVCFKFSGDYQQHKRAIYALEDPQNISSGGIYRAKSTKEVQNLVDAGRKFFGYESNIIYGGSVNEENAQDLASIKNLNGVLVGNASLNPAEFADIVGKFSV